MEDTLVGLEVAKKAKEVGFSNGSSNSFNYHPEEGYRESYKFVLNFCKYNDIEFENTINKQPESKDFERPTQSLLQKWLREVYKIDVEIRFIGYADLSLEYHTKVNFIKDGLWEYILVTKNKSNLDYREALEIGLMAGLKLIKNK